MSQLKYITATSDDFVRQPTPAHFGLGGEGFNHRAIGLNATGYGKKITTIYKVSHNGRLYRVYATCYSNCASHWIMCKGEKLFVRDFRP